MELEPAVVAALVGALTGGGISWWVSSSTARSQRLASQRAQLRAERVAAYQDALSAVWAHQYQLLMYGELLHTWSMPRRRTAAGFAASDRMRDVAAAMVRAQLVASPNAAEVIGWALHVFGDSATAVSGGKAHDGDAVGRAHQELVDALRADLDSEALTV